ncbi:MAG: nicotinate-nucleotide adenylyltransferase [Sphingomonadales bacterium]|jgi:nicotinate-nucleotide adenylyltransferase|nr:nicotinate-nucleotide adenylyltransferase [Sphingomonadales bacterium]MBK9002415.1 nicotinate-nucleotide adenylyltransferase [Sphingomonadales bacterium]MBK9267645.1 nicotinate-nucleotide adenylyltransferase [Sphingomonadales bacterium]MBP6435630.1 nicotinate-nucleotide adenylyltransferase [Sphingorhabdus sp.]
MTTTGLLGGSFNPAHGGHRSISLFALDALALDEIWWLVSPGNPLKAASKDMASHKARLASARKMARRAPIRATAIEAQMGTRYTINTLRKLVRRYPNRRFIWIMGADNVANFTRWRRWRDIARLMPIAVIARPGYDDDAVAGSAMAWLRRYVRRPDQRLYWTMWSTPALVFLRFRPDPRSATAVRQANPHWHRDYEGKRVIDGVTHKVLL